MIMTTPMLLEKYSDFSDPYGKIRRLVEAGQLFQITRGIYEDDGNQDGRLISTVLYGPSYLSFNYALSFYGLIPEGVREYTSATYGKGKKKYYENHFGRFSFRDIPEAAFPHETILKDVDGYSFHIASPEKAICDKLYELPPVKNQSQLYSLLFEDMRIDEDIFSELDFKVIRELCPLYKSRNTNLLSSFIKRFFHE